MSDRRWKEKSAVADKSRKSSSQEIKIVKALFYVGMKKKEGGKGSRRSSRRRREAYITADTGTVIRPLYLISVLWGACGWNRW